MPLFKQEILNEVKYSLIPDAKNQIETLLRQEIISKLNDLEEDMTH